MNPMERKMLTQDVWPLKDGICSRVTTAEASKIREMVQSRGWVFRIDQELVVMLTSDLENALYINKHIDLTRPSRYPDFIKLNAIRPKVNWTNWIPSQLEPPSGAPNQVLFSMP